MKTNTYMFVYLVGKFRSKHCGGNKTNTQTNISKAFRSGLEVICCGEKYLEVKEVNDRTNENGGDPDIPGKVVNMR